MDELMRTTDRAADVIRDIVRLLSMVRFQNFLRRLGVMPPPATPTGPTPAPVLRRETWQNYVRRLENPGD